MTIVMILMGIAVFILYIKIKDESTRALAAEKKLVNMVAMNTAVRLRHEEEIKELTVELNNLKG
ncbi:hypothetical protein [Vibrio splendidus]|uniref:hypothetical protein n=1 Tax=Vibrio splendidus TaxID=29497 RepID=UPI000D386741|nr:hypothetical protein [Vibrio splendidus]PTP95474.1 hypothetical protein CWO02_01125 [Vibrio splendidus]